MYDEMLNKNALKPRKIYDKLFSWLNNQNSSTLLNQSNKAEELFRRVGDSEEKIRTKITIESRQWNRKFNLQKYKFRNKN